MKKELKILANIFWICITELFLLIGLFASAPGLIVISMALVAVKWFIDMYNTIHKGDDDDFYE